MEDELSRRIFRTLIGPFCLIGIAAAGLALLSFRGARPDLFDLVPKALRMDGYVLVAWPSLERAKNALDARAIPSGTMIRTLGYMTDSGQPLRDGASVESFVLLPDAGIPLHPTYRHGDQMIAVRLETGKTIRFSEGSLVWVWGRLQMLPGDPEGRDPLYALESARVETAVKADIAKYFR